MCFYIEVANIDYIFKAANSYVKLIRIISFVFRFISNLKCCTKERGPLSSTELRRGKVFLIKYVQTQAFSMEIKALTKKGRSNSLI